MNPITILYALLFLCALILIYVYKALLKENADKMGYLVLIAIAITNFGYFLLSCSKSVELAIFSNRLSYTGSIILLVGTYMIVNEFCNVKNSKTANYVIQVLSILALLLALTGGSSIKLFYQSVDIKIVNNLTQLVKVYGPLHFVYGLYVFVIFVITLSAVIFSLVKKKVLNSVNPIILLLLVTENMMVWYVEKLLHVEMELLSFSYVITGAIFVFLFKNNYDYLKLNNSVNVNKEIKTVDQVIDNWRETYKLTNRELDIVKYLIDNIPRSEIAEKLFISEHTVKKHTTNIYEKLHIISRNDLLHKLNEELTH